MDNFDKEKVLWDNFDNEKYCGGRVLQ